MNTTKRQPTRNATILTWGIILGALVAAALAAADGRWVPALIFGCASFHFRWSLVLANRNGV